VRFTTLIILPSRVNPWLLVCSASVCSEMNSDRIRVPYDSQFRAGDISSCHAPKIDRTAALRSRAALSRTCVPSMPSRTPITRDEIAARQLHALKQHYAGKLRLSDVKEMFEQMRDHA
jgi:hypothetical protein